MHNASISKDSASSGRNYFNHLTQILQGYTGLMIRYTGFQTRTAEAEFEIYGRDHMFVIRACR